MDRLQPVSSLSFWVRDRINSLGFRGAARRQLIDSAPTRTGGSALWFGYAATNATSFEGACLVSERGLRLPLTPLMQQVFTDRSPPGHLGCWEIPSLLTNRGRYRLIVPALNRTVLTFVNE